jgi:hypothetical protein
LYLFLSSYRVIELNYSRRSFSYRGIAVVREVIPLITEFFGRVNLPGHIMPVVRPEFFDDPPVIAGFRPFILPSEARAAPARRHRFDEWQRAVNDWEEEVARRQIAIYCDRIVEIRDSIGDEVVRRFPGTFIPAVYQPHPLPDVTPDPSVASTDLSAEELRDQFCPTTINTEYRALVREDLRLRHQDPAHIVEYPLSDLSECTTCGCYTFGRCPGCQHCARQGGLNGEFFIELYGVPYRPLCSTCQHLAVGALCRFCRFELEAQRISTLQNWVDRAALSIETGVDYFNPTTHPDGCLVRYIDDIRTVPAEPRRFSPDPRQSLFRPATTCLQAEGNAIEERNAGPG